MQGYIINITPVKEEDLIVTIISKHNLYTLYRFYGARHGSINIGFKIDFEIEYSSKSTIARLKDVIHIGFNWLHNYNLLQLWQKFIHLFFLHLHDAEELDEFYFNLIEEASKKWDKQNPKRVAIESYVKLLKFEGRLHNEDICFLCSTKIEDNIALIRAFLPTHSNCSKTMPVNKQALKELYENNSTLFLSDKEIERLWSVLLEGL